MLSFLEISAAINASLSTILLFLCGAFVYRLWLDMVGSADVGSVGFFLVFSTIFLFDLWNAVVYGIIALPGPEPGYLPALTVLKPIIHALEIISFLLLYLHFRKRE